MSLASNAQTFFTVGFFCNGIKPGGEKRSEDRGASSCKFGLRLGLYAVLATLPAVLARGAAGRAEAARSPSPSPSAPAESYF